MPWRELREQRLLLPAAQAGHEQARAAYELGKMIRELREAEGLSQRQLAARVGTTQSVVGRLEAGGSRPTLATLERVARARSPTGGRFQHPEPPPGTGAKRRVRAIAEPDAGAA